MAHLCFTPCQKAHFAQVLDRSDGVGKENVRIAIKNGTNFTENTGLLTYFAELMPQDNNGGKINESEAIHFTRFFVKEIRKAKIPWSLNSLEKYYIMGKGKWRRRPLTIEGQQLNMSKILDNIIELMPKGLKNEIYAKLGSVTISTHKVTGTVFVVITFNN